MVWLVIYLFVYLYNGTFIEAGDSEARKSLAEKKQQDCLVWTAWFPKNILGKK